MLIGGGGRPIAGIEHWFRRKLGLERGTMEEMRGEGLEETNPVVKPPHTMTAYYMGKCTRHAFGAIKSSSLQSYLNRACERRSWTAKKRDRSAPLKKRGGVTTYLDYTDELAQVIDLTLKMCLFHIYDVRLVHTQIQRMGDDRGKAGCRSAEPEGIVTGRVSV
jgi:hypothetical protein